ncbi:hypothetical protein BHM03_00046727 [Ensete ventricosum]|nr:hypothetical protein BHM03_00046727 [Ensete ventricosum]
MIPKSPVGFALSRLKNSLQRTRSLTHSWPTNAAGCIPFRSLASYLSMRLEEEEEEEEAEEEKERKNLRRSSGKISIMVFVAPEKLTVLLIILLASLPSNAMAGKSFG